MFGDAPGGDARGRRRGCSGADGQSDARDGLLDSGDHGQGVVGVLRGGDAGRTKWRLVGPKHVKRVHFPHLYSKFAF